MSDILIRGAKMPPKGKYDLSLYVLANGESFIKNGGEYNEVVELPPHGDLIDRDAVHERYNHDSEKPEICNSAQDFGWIDQCLYEAPVIVPAEREGE